MLTVIAKVVHQNDLMEEVLWRPLYHTGHCAEEYSKCLIAKYDHHRSGGQILGVTPTQAPKIMGNRFTYTLHTLTALTDVSIHTSYVMNAWAVHNLARAKIHVF